MLRQLSSVTQPMLVQNTTAKSQTLISITRNFKQHRKFQQHLALLHDSRDFIRKPRDIVLWPMPFCCITVVISKVLLCRWNCAMQNARRSSVRRNERPSSAISTRLDDERSLWLTSRVAMATGTLTPKSTPAAWRHRKLVFPFSSDPRRIARCRRPGRVVAGRGPDERSGARGVSRV